MSNFRDSQNGFLRSMLSNNPDDLHRFLADERADRERVARDERTRRRDARIEALSDRVKNPKLLAVCRTTPSLSALILGPSGIGKTSAAILLALLCDDENPPHFANAQDISSADRRTALGVGTPPDIEAAKKAPSLILDDLGSYSDKRSLFEVIDYRYRRSLPTLVTTGMTSLEFGEYFGGAFVRRINEQHAGHPQLLVDLHEPPKRGGNGVAP